MEDKKQSVVSIIGMHRSGTSMVARLLNLCGLDLGPPEDLLTSREDNITGFFENWRFVEINEALLSHFGGSWDNPPKLQSGWEHDPSLEPIVQKARALLEGFSTSSHWGWKDPRTTILIPFWRLVVHDLKFIICIRNPLDVARSLMKRDGMSIIQAAALWNRYTQTAIQQTQGSGRLVIFYDDFFDNPAGETDRLAKFCALRLPDNSFACCEAVAQDLRHHASGPFEILGEAQLPTESKLLYVGLRVLSPTPVAPQYVDPDRHHSPQDAYAHFLQLVETLGDGRPAIEPVLLTRLQVEIETQQRHIGQLEQATKEKDDTTHALQTRVGILQSMLDEKLRSLAELHTRLVGIEENPVWKTFTIFRSHLKTMARFANKTLPLPTQWKRSADKFALRYLTFIFSSSATDSVPAVPETLSLRKPLSEMDASMSETSLDAVGSPLTLRQELYDETSQYYEPMCARPVGETPVKLIAFYLPQFHPIPENDLWWGRGFTEWTNVVRAKPQFQGHYQPHIPIDLGFYDLRIAEIQKQQIEMARHFGVFGFCYYYYWFNGRQLLDRPLMQVLQDSDLEFPYCICWANENWTRRWDGQDQEILIAQNHSAEGDLAFIQSLERFFRDRRYIRIDGKPLLIVYRADLLPHVKATIRSWRQYCLESGIGEIYLVAARTFGFENPAPLGFDAAVEFPPHGVSAREITSQVQLFNPKFRGRIFSYEDIVRQAQAFIRPKYPVFRTVMPLWDNSARRGNGGHIFAASSPTLYRDWLDSVCDYTTQQFPEGQRMVFVNAWNEWAEGAHLEPDRRYGYAYLNATANALRKCNGKIIRPNGPRRVTVSVVVPAYNHETYIRKALKSLEDQTANDFEVIVVNDGSTDRTAEIAQEFAATSRCSHVRVLNQPNTGTHAAINRGVDESVGEYIAILNSDDYYHPERLELLAQSLQSSDSQIAFSDFEIVDMDSEPVGPDDSYANLLRTKVSQISQFPHLGYALLDFNIAVSSGNLFFKRDLFDLVGGFTELKYCHDWDFILTALRYTTPLFVRRRLYYYRLHPGNSFRDLQSLAEKESQIVLSKFFAFEQSQGQVRRGFPGHKNDSPYFAQFVKQHKYESFLRRALQIDGKTATA